MNGKSGEERGRENKKEMFECEWREEKERVNDGRRTKKKEAWTLCSYSHTLVLTYAPQLTAMATTANPSTTPSTWSSTPSDDSYWDLKSPSVLESTMTEPTRPA